MIEEILLALIGAGVFGHFAYSWFKRPVDKVVERVEQVAVPKVHPPRVRGKAPKCEICNHGLELWSVKTHDGKWRCSEHKGSK